MPNWCEHDITISGPKTEMARLKDLIAGAVTDEGVSLLQMFLPRPMTLEHTTSPARMPHSELEIEAAGGAEAALMLAANEEYSKCEAELIAMHGASNWYDWSYQTWGVKWPDSSKVVHQGPRSIVMRGICPWAPPLAGLCEISTMFPRLRFTIEWFEAGMQFAGKAVYLDGVELSMQQRPYRGWRGG